jgi:hypothetical protein
VQARDQLGAACATADAIKIRALHQLARSVDTSSSPGGVLFAMNHLPWPSVVVQFDTMSLAPGQRTHLRSSDDGMISVQWTASEYHPAVRRWRRPHGSSICAAMRLSDLRPRQRRRNAGRTAAASRIAGAMRHPGRRAGITSLRADDGRERRHAGGVVVIADDSDTAHRRRRLRSELGCPAFESADVIDDGQHVRVVRQRGAGETRRRAGRRDVAPHAGRRLRLRADWRAEADSGRADAVRARARSPPSLEASYAERLTAARSRARIGSPSKARSPASSYSLGVVNDATYCTTARRPAAHDAAPLRAVRRARSAKLPDEFARPYLDQGWQERRSGTPPRALTC